MGKSLVQSANDLKRLAFKWAVEERGEQHDSSGQPDKLGRVQMLFQFALLRLHILVGPLDDVGRVKVVVA